jgi:hypothetical protein
MTSEKRATSAVGAAISKATADARAAEAHVKSLSAARLADLMGLSAHERFSSLDDQLLTAKDRNRLRTSIHASLPLGDAKKNRRAHILLPRRLKLFVLRQFKRPGRIIAMIVVCAIACATGLEIYENTAHQFHLNSAVGVVWQMPGAAPQDELLPAGSRVFVLSHSPESLVFRKWVDGIGYAIAIVKQTGR